VDDDHGIGGIGEPVNGPPYSRLDPGAEQAGDDDRGNQVHGHGAEPDPEALVGRGERDNRREPWDVHISVGNGCDDVGAEEGDREE